MGRWWRSWPGRAVLLTLVIAALVALPLVAQAVETPDISGRVTVDGTEAPIANAYVYVYREVSGNWDWVGDTYTDASGDYQFQGLEDGTYWVYFGNSWSNGHYYEWTYPADYASVALDASSRPVTVNAVLSEKFPDIQGAVTDATTGDPLQSVEIAAYQGDGAGSYFFYNMAYPQSDGSYSFFWLPEGEYKLNFFDWEFGVGEWWDNATTIEDATPIAVTAGTTQHADATMNRPAPSLSGRITNEQTGDPVQYDSAVSIYRMADEGYWDYYEWVGTGANGRWKVYGLPAGTYRVISEAWGDPGYYQEAWDDKGRSLEDGDDIVLADGEYRAGIDAALTPIPEAKPDAFEPDDSAFHARLVEPDGGPRLHSLWPKYDEDWVKFPVKAGRLYTADMQSVGYDWFNGDFEFLDGDGGRVDAWRSYYAEEDGYAFVRVSSYGGRVDRDNCWYNLSIAEDVPASIAGTVRADDTAEPLQGVYAELLSYQSEEAGGWWDWTDSAATDAAGRYEFDRVSPSRGAYRLNFGAWELPDYVSEYYDDVTTLQSAKDIALEPGEAFVADASLARAAKFEGVVTAEDGGAPLSDICVRVEAYSALSGYASGYYSEHTDGEGRFEIGGLAAGTYKVYYYDHMSSYATEWYDNAADPADAAVVEIDRGETRILDAALALQPSAGHLRGKVVDRATGAPLAGIRVTYITGAQGTSSYASGYIGWTDSVGEYRRGELDPSLAYTVRFSDPQSGYLDQYFDDKPEAATADPVVLTAGAWSDANASLDLDLSKGRISGVIRDAETLEPIPYAWVYADSSGYASGYGGGWHEAYADGEGRYVLRGLTPGDPYVLHAGGPDGDYSDGEWYLEQYYNKQNSRDAADLVVMSEGELRTIDFDLMKPARLSGIVTEEGTGRPVKGVRVEAYGPMYASGYQLSGYAWTDSKGAFEFGYLAPNTPYKLAFLDDEKGVWVSEFYNDKATLGESDDLVLNSGANVVNAELAPRPDVGAITGMVTDAHSLSGTPLVQVDLMYVDTSSGYSSGYWSRAHTMPDGSFSFDGLPKRFSYKLKFSDPYGGARYAEEYYSDKPDFDSADQIAFDESTARVVANASLVPLTDSLPPVVSASAAPAANADGWRKAPATVTLSATDLGSGVGTIRYRIGSGVEAVYGGPFATPTGASEVTYWATDNVGNTSDEQSLAVMSDAVKPTASVVVAPAANIDGWSPESALVTLSAVDSESGVAAIKYSVNAGAETPYDAAFAVPTGSASIEYWAVDKVGNEGNHQWVTTKCDGASPTTTASYVKEFGKWAPARATVTLSATDGDSGVASTQYCVRGGVSYPYAAPFTVEAAVGAAEEILVEARSMDKVGNSETTKTVSVWCDDADPSVPTGVTGSPLSESKMGLWWIASTDEGSGVVGYKVYKDGAFLSAASGTSLLVDGFTPGSSADFQFVAIDGVGNESGISAVTRVTMPAADKPATVLKAGFGSATDSRTELTVDYGKSATLVGKLTGANGIGLVNKSVVVERWDAKLAKWVKVKDATAGASAGEYRASVTAADRTTFHMRFAGDAGALESTSANRTLMPKTSVRTPIAPKTMSRTKYYKVYGSLKPRHAAGSYPVRIYKWRKTSTGKWKSYGYVKAKAYNDGSYTKYSVKLRLSKAGTWRLRAYTPKDTLHAATWSSGYDYVKVK